VIVRATSLAVAAALVAVTAITSAQGGGKPTTGNPTPGIAQPDPPNPANRVTFVGCLQSVTRRADASTTPGDSNTPSSSRFELTRAEPLDRVTTGSASKIYRLEGIDSQFSPFIGAKVEISGEIKSPAGASSPTLLVEFVRRIAAKCS
jgi:hypothetical protein